MVIHETMQVKRNNLNNYGIEMAAILQKLSDNDQTCDIWYNVPLPLKLECLIKILTLLKYCVST